MEKSALATASILPLWIENGALNKASLLEEVTECAKKLSSQLVDQQKEGASNLYSLIMTVWSLETHLARDAADIVCDEIRENGGLELMLQLCSTTNDSLQLSIARALDQIMVSANRHYIATHRCFDSVMTMIMKQASCESSLEAMRCGTGILENLFKISRDICLRLIHCGALERVIYACRSTDPTVLQHCAAALANCAMYGDHKVHSLMVAKHADHWLFPLAFSNDNVVKYYGLLTISFLASDVNLIKKVAESGTLDLVLPFLNKQYPEEFAQSCPNHAHGRSAGWLKQLVPLLVCESEEARSLAAFHFAMEAGIKRKQLRLNVFKEINAVSGLQAAAKRGSQLTAKFSCDALKLCDSPLPKYQCWNTLNWSTDNVSAWIEDIGLGQQLASAFQEHLVTGTILIDLTLEDLLEIGFKSKVKGKWFLEEVRKLRCLCDVSGYDDENICKWLTGIHSDLAVYCVDFVRSGVTKSILPHLSDEILSDIGVKNRLDRLKILLSLGEMPSFGGQDTPDFFSSQLIPSPVLKRKYDVFISYRRSSGSQLASLLKVHLQTRGVSVFLDVTELGSGKFDEALLTMIKNSHNICLVLTPSSLDRCKGDARLQDWVHRELLCANDNSVQVVPVTDPGFEWPNSKDLPEDIRYVLKLNAVLWSHEYQDACVEKLVSFLHLPGMPRRKSLRTVFSFQPSSS